MSAIAALTAAAPAQTETPAFPEPDPITVDPATVDRAKRVLDEVARGTFDRSELAPKLNAFADPGFFEKAKPYVTALGAPQSMYPFEKRILADQTSTFFRVRYAKEILTYVFSVDDADRIVGLSLRRAPNRLLVNIVWRDVQY